jgi:ubiquinone/menaquinone biosynthesis C-methylase UbiE
MTVKKFDSAKAGKFAEDLLDTLNKSSLSLMISVGHRTGLFDTMKSLEPCTSLQIAQAAKLNERYVREWLGAMVTGKVVEYFPDTRTYKLPAEHSAFLTRSAGADNLAAFTQYISVLGAVEDEIIKCFKSGGGVPYEKFQRFHEVMAEDSGQSVLSSLDTHIIPLIPGLHEKLTQGINVLDVGCGAGRIMIKLASMYPNSKFTGIDLSREAIEFAENEAKSGKLKNIHFIVQDLSNFDESAADAEYDLITTFDAIHDQAKPLNVLKGIYKALKDSGTYLMQDISGTGRLEEDISHPIGTFLYTISCMHCMTVSLAQDGEGLGAMWGEIKTKEYLRKAGFNLVETNKLAHDIQNNWYVAKK